MKRFKDQYWIKSGFLTVLQNFSGVLFGFGSFLILVRLLSKEDYGVWVLFMTAINILELARNGLIQNALVKFLAQTSKEDAPKVISASFTISWGLTAIFIMANFLFVPSLANMWHSPKLVNMFYLYNIVFLLTGILNQFNAIEQAHLNFKGVFLTNFIRQGSLFAYIAFCSVFNFHTELLYLVYVQIFSAVISTALGYFLARPYLRNLSYKLYPEWVKKLFNYGKYSFGTSISSIISGSIDQMMLGAYLGPAKAGVFNIAMRITNLIEIPINAVSTIVFPQSAKRIESEGKTAIKYLYEKSVGSLLAILIPGLLFLYFFADFVVVLIAGEKNAESVPLLRVTLLYCLMIPYGRQFGTILNSIGKTRLTFYMVLFNALVNIAFNYFLIHRWGIIGAAYATLFSNINGFIIAQVILKKELNISQRNILLYAVNFYPEFFKRYIKAPKAKLHANP
ncbi:flippase [Foetidibacter luteolus]|uniref:flippase n=1 Tax=Foetidibacter luteolus TaxID=2608880 RepID=UPI00129C0767|nr:flippase [Foetidibacter luteolus]